MPKPPPALFTLVVALDPYHADQLQGAWRTWIRHHPSLLNFPMLAVCDVRQKPEPWWRHRLNFLRHPQLKLLDWDWPDPEDRIDESQISQRERMLTAFVCAVPFVCDSRYYLKIDTDVICTHPVEPFPDPAWFGKLERRLDSTHHPPVMIASPWGYTKPASWPGQMQAWANTVEDLKHYAPLDFPPPAPEQQVYRYKRVCSWLAFVDVVWARWVSSHLPRGRLPVPSHDTVLWYIAARRRDFVLPVKFSGLGWSTISSDRRRRKAIEESLHWQGSTPATSAS